VFSVGVPGISWWTIRCIVEPKSTFSEKVMGTTAGLKNKMNLRSLNKVRISISA
jgi:hypothetical protein